MMQRLSVMLGLAEKWLKNAVMHEKELEYWKAKSTKEVKQIAYENSAK